MLRRIAIAAVLIAGASAPAFAGWQGHWIGPVGGFASVLLIVALMLLVVSFFGATRRAVQDVPLAAAPVPRANATAFAILSERFARGEIDAGEYEGRRRVLSGEGPSETASTQPSAPPPSS